MSNNNYWGPITWNFLHTFAEKIKDEEYSNQKEKILYFIKKICNNLPCPDCQAHASKYLKPLQVKHIEKKEELKKLLFIFHNNVNERINKKKQDIEIIESYKQKHTLKVFYEFITVYSKPVHNNRLMMDSMNRNLLMKELVSYLQENVNKFSK